MSYSGLANGAPDAARRARARSSYVNVAEMYEVSWARGDFQALRERARPNVSELCPFGRANSLSVWIENLPAWQLLRKLTGKIASSARNPQIRFYSSSFAKSRP